MKRCSQCHFTFDDYEEICDFDGTPLIPHQESERSFEHVSARLAALSPSWRTRLIQSRVSASALGLGVMAGALLIGHFDSASHAKRNLVAKVEAQPLVSLDPLVPSKSSAARRIAARKAFRSKPKPSINRRSVALVRRPTIASRPQARIRPARSAKQARALKNANQSRESKVTAAVRKTGGIFKKTVSILKKPFDF